MIVLGAVIRLVAMVHWRRTSLDDCELGTTTYWLKMEFINRSATPHALGPSCYFLAFQWCFPVCLGLLVTFLSSPLPPPPDKARGEDANRTLQELSIGSTSSIVKSSFPSCIRVETESYSAFLNSDDSWQLRIDVNFVLTLKYRKSGHRLSPKKKEIVVNREGGDLED